MKFKLIEPQTLCKAQKIRDHKNFESSKDHKNRIIVHVPNFPFVVLFRLEL